MNLRICSCCFSCCCSVTLVDLFSTCTQWLQCFCKHLRHSVRSLKEIDMSLVPDLHYTKIYCNSSLPCARIEPLLTICRMLSYQNLNLKISDNGLFPIISSQIHNFQDRGLHFLWLIFHLLNSKNLIDLFGLNVVAPVPLCFETVYFPFGDKASGFS